MSLGDLASLGSFVSGIAVLVSLVALTIQMRQNTRVIIRAEANAAQEQQSNWRLTIASSAELSDIWVRAMRDEDLSEVEERRYSFLVFDLALAIFQTWDRKKKGMLASDDAWHLTAPALALVLATRHGSAWWERSRNRFAPDYAAALDAFVRNAQPNGTVATADAIGPFKPKEPVGEGKNP